MSPGGEDGASPARPYLACAAVFFAALATHAIVAWQYRADPFATTLVADALSYHRWAERLAANGLGGEPVFHQAPLFPLLLYVVYSSFEAGARDLWVRGLQIVLSASAIAMLVPLGRAWFGRLSAGIGGALLALLFAPFTFYAMKLLPVPLALATQAGGLLALGHARRTQGPRAAALAGAAWGLACLTRAEMLLFVPLGLWALHPRGGRTGRGRILAGIAAYLVGLAVVIAPATWHNARRGDSVLVASAAGENLFIGNQRGAAGGYKPLRPGAGDIFSQRVAAQQLAERAAGRELRPSEVSAHWRRRAISEISHDPPGWLRLELGKLGRMLHPGDPTDLYSLAAERSVYLPALHALPVASWTLWLLGLSGMAWMLRRDAGRVWPLAAFVAVQAVVLLVFFVDARLRLPLLYALCPFAGAAAVAVIGLARSPGTRRRAWWAAAAVAATLTAGVVATRPTPRDLVRLSSVLSREGRLDEARSVLTRELQRTRPDAATLDQAGWVSQKRGGGARRDGRPAEADRALREARRLYLEALDADLGPGRARQTRTRLAQVHEALGEIALAAAAHDAAVASGTANAGTYYERGTFRLRHGDLAGAERDLRQAARLDPSWPAPRRALDGSSRQPR